MRALRLLPLLFTTALIWLLNSSIGSLPPLGRLLDPVNGCWAAAEPTDKNFSRHLKIRGLQQPVNIWLEDRLVPHIRAGNDHDLYLAQGYVHAYFRLWQMDLQTRAAGGRISEVIGKKGLEFDRGQRRKGMVYAAERSLKAMEADPRTEQMLDAYTAGINAYIHSLSFRELPLEYKLMNFTPEPWTNLKCALLLKYMADDLTGKSDDIQLTMLHDELGEDQFNFLFPEKIKGSKPVIPEGTKFDAPSLRQPAYPGDSVWAHFTAAGQATAQTYSSHKYAAATSPGDVRDPESESGIGSNNWAISGKHTASGAPILCNDPHLGLNLPSLWFEIQLTAPGINTYGASLPGAPGIVIGFNDAISWGFTNNYRDVKDYYDITASDCNTYLFNGRQVPFDKRVERIGVKGESELLDTVLYTLHGPVQYDATFPDPKKTGHMLAMTWMAHRPTNEVLALYLMNRAPDYNAFVAAIQHFECPAQNFAYADKAGNIAMWGQGRFINKWKGQGKFVMEGRDSGTLWGQDIPMNENPHVLNPPQGYVASANQRVTDSTYPYWYNGDFVEFRSWAINLSLTSNFGERITGPYRSIFSFERMMRLQNQTWSYLLQSLPESLWANVDESTYNNRIQSSGWKLSDRDEDVYSDGLGPLNKESTVYQIWWSQLYKDIWQDEFPNSTLYPLAERTMQLLLTDSTSQYYDDRTTPQKETLRDIVQRAFKETTDSLDKLKATTGLEWYKVKNTSLTHLAKIPAFSYTQLKTGGWGNTINAMKQHHGPSWRMIVEMGKTIKAYGVYPGGQNGNPGSRHYGDFIDYWVAGNYYELQFLAATTVRNPFRYAWILQP
jgi:penicillin amidase